MAIIQCTLGRRHQWQFVRNITIVQQRSNAREAVGTFSLKGLYKCACSAKKHGQPQQGMDLRGLIKGAA